MKQKNLLAILISVVLLSVFLPVALQIFYEYEVSKTQYTSLNNNRTTILLNQSSSGAYNSSILEPSFTDYTDIEFNVTSDLSVNYILEFTITIDNISAVEVITANLTINGVNVYDFNESDAYDTNFLFNTKFTKTDIDYSAISLELNLLLDIDSNTTMTTSARFIETYTDTYTDQVQAIYIILPLMFVIGIVLMFVKKMN